MIVRNTISSPRIAVLTTDHETLMKNRILDKRCQFKIHDKLSRSIGYGGFNMHVIYFILVTHILLIRLVAAVLTGDYCSSVIASQINLFGVTVLSVLVLAN